MALQVLCHNIRNIRITVAMMGNFNIRDSNWDPNFHHYFIHTEDVLTITNSLGLKLFSSSNLDPTRYANNPRDTNSVPNLVFLPSSNSGFGQHIFYPKMCENYQIMSFLLST